MQIVFLVLMFIVGSCVGSFLCCQARRMRLRDAEDKTRVSRKKSKKTRTKKAQTTKASLGTRSVCMSCRKQLKWYDNIPIVSWIILRGKCRQCGKKIGMLEILSEIGVGAATVMVSVGTDVSTAGAMEWATYGVLLMLTFILSFLAIYDGAYGELPSLCLTLAIICAIILLTLRDWVGDFDGWSLGMFLEPLGAVTILGGVYLVLYLVSRGRWVGDGDWLLGTALGLALGQPWLALVALFLANFLACIIMFPVVKKRQNTKIHFGPFMVIAWVVVECFSGILMQVI